MALAQLAGLTFVVIALASEARRVDPVGLDTFVTPTIVHFGVVLALAAFMCVPHQTALSSTIGLAASGLGGLAYTGKVTANVHHRPGIRDAPVHRHPQRLGHRRLDELAQAWGMMDGPAGTPTRFQFGLRP